MRKELQNLRNVMNEAGIDIYIIPTTDFHGSEYVNDYFKCREYISGFTGSAGTLVVEKDFAGLWTDGRYFIQAAQQLENSGIALMKMGEPEVPTLEEYIFEHNENTVVGFDGRVISMELGDKLAGKFKVIHNIDLVDKVWIDRPEIIPSEIYPLELSVTGETAESKIKRLQQEMTDKGVDYMLISRLEDNAWLFNLRAADIAYTPVFYSFTIISREKCSLYMMDGKYCPENMDVKSYSQIYGDISSLRNCKVLVDKNTVSYSMSKSFHESVEIVMDSSPVENFKAVKNAIEIKATKDAHIKDGAAMAEFICWLKNNVGKQVITEISAADYLESCRRKYGAYDLSFTTIAGYEEHGAIIHYGATEETDIEIKPEGFILVDSGGQYHNGTTDITRTIALGAVPKERKTHYTAVLKGHIALAMANFEKGTTGAQLDEIARKPIKELGLNFNHGTGHGVGHLLSVHEGPNTISPRGTESQILPGMITSNEPGLYFEGKYGIRIENEILCYEEDGICKFESITLCPYEKDAIDMEMLTDKELDHINNYHKKVYELVSPLVDEETKAWLDEACAEIQR